jgi:hypothetical protein
VSRGLALALGLWVFAVGAGAEEAAGVKLPDTLTFDGQTLVLNGTGVRTKFRIPIYVGGLYLTKKSSDSETVCDAQQATAIRMHMVYGRLTGQQMVTAIEEGFAKATGGDTAPFSEDLEMLTSSVEQVAVDDVVDIYYLPGSGLGVELNGVHRGGTQDVEFIRAVFRIWLGPDPVHGKLKRGMLGG